MGLQDVDTMKALCLRPASYSKAQSVAEIIYHLRLYPAQKPTGSLSSDEHNYQYVTDHVIEFRIEGLRPVGTLFEIRNQFKDIDLYYIYPNKGNGLIIVKYTQGVFAIADGFGDGWTD